MKQISIRNSIKPMQDLNWITICNMTIPMVDISYIFLDPFYELLDDVKGGFADSKNTFVFEIPKESLNFEYENSLY